jgi:hypothetical protein
MFSNPDAAKQRGLRLLRTRLPGCLAALLLAGCASVSCPPPSINAVWPTPPPEPVALPSTPPIEAPPQPPVNTSAPAADELIIMPLAAQEAEIRRLKDLLEKQTQLTRELQHKLDQTQERLRALKAIERSLSQRAPTAPRAPQVPAP